MYSANKSWNMYHMDKIVCNQMVLYCHLQDDNESGTGVGGLKPAVFID